MRNALIHTGAKNWWLPIISKHSFPLQQLWQHRQGSLAHVTSFVELTSSARWFRMAAIVGWKWTRRIRFWRRLTIQKISSSCNPQKRHVCVAHSNIIEARWLENTERKRRIRFVRTRPYTCDHIVNTFGFCELEWLTASSHVTPKWWTDRGIGSFDAHARP